MRTTTQQLQGLEGAARLAGSTAAAMDSGIVSLNDNLTKAAQGVAPDALVAFDRLGIALKDSTGHVRKATSVLPELADKLQAVKDPTIKLELLTRIFGGSAEQMFRVLDGGSAVLQRNIDLAMKAGVQTDAQIKRSRELQYAEADLTNSISGLSNEIIGSLAPAPALTPMLGDMTRWIPRSRPRHRRSHRRGCGSRHRAGRAALGRQA